MSCCLTYPKSKWVSLDEDFIFSYEDNCKVNFLKQKTLKDTKKLSYYEKEETLKSKKKTETLKLKWDKEIKLNKKCLVYFKDVLLSFLKTNFEKSFSYCSTYKKQSNQYLADLKGKLAEKRFFNIANNAKKCGEILGIKNVIKSDHFLDSQGIDFTITLKEVDGSLKKHFFQIKSSVAGAMYHFNKYKDKDIAVVIVNSKISDDEIIQKIKKKLFSQNS